MKTSHAILLGFCSVAALCLLLRKKENATAIGGIGGKKSRRKSDGQCSEIIITIERIPTHTQSVYKPQGEYAPYCKCQRSGITPTALGMLYDCKDIKKNISNLKKLIKNWSIDTPEEFLLVVSNTIGAQPSIEIVRRADEVNEISYYLNLPQYSLRLGLHNMNAANYKGNRKRPKNYGVTFKNPQEPDTFRPAEGVDVAEYVYIDSDQERMKSIAQAILHLLESGEWDEQIAPSDYKNTQL